MSGFFDTNREGFFSFHKKTGFSKESIFNADVTNKFRKLFNPTRNQQGQQEYYRNPLASKKNNRQIGQLNYFTKQSSYPVKKITRHNIGEQ